MSLATTSRKTRLPSQPWSRLVGAISAVAVLLAALFVGAPSPSPADATSSHTLFYSPFQGPNKVSKFSGSTDTATWSSGTGSSGNAQAVAANDTHVFWSYESKVFRQEISTDAGSTATEFFNVNWYSSFPQQLPSIKALVIDAPYIYILAQRNLDGGTVFRADLATGVRDSSWTYSTGGLPCSGLAADGSSTGSIYISCAFSDKIIRLSKAATSGGPTTVVSPWLSNNEIASGNSFVTSLVSDGTYLYWRTTAGTIRRAPMQDATPGSSTTVVAALPTDEVISGLAMYDGTIYIGSSFGRSGQFIVFSAVPSAVTPATPTPFATIGSGGLRGLAVRTIPVPAVTPTISSQPTGVSVTVGDVASFSVSASRTDSGVLSYQWRKGGVDISGANLETYSISSTALTDAGTYSVVVTNTLGASVASVTSSDAVLTVTAAVATPTAGSGGSTPTTSTPTTTPATSTVPAANAPALVTSANQSQLTSSPGEGKALVNGVATKVEVAQIDIPAADKAPSERSATEVREVQVAAKELVDDLNDLLPSGATPPAVVVNTNTGAVITGVVKNISVPVEDVLVVKTSDQAVLVAGVNKSGTEVAPVGKIGGPEIDEGGQVAAIAYGLNPGDSGEFIVMSTPTLLSSFTVETNGTFREQAVLPVGLAAGRHTLVVATPKVAVSFGFTIVAVTELPATGSATSIPMGTWAFGLLFSGLCLAILVRRRTGLFN
jgi:hypothetical protein